MIDLQTINYFGSIENNVLTLKLSHVRQFLMLKPNVSRYNSRIINYLSYN